MAPQGRSVLYEQLAASTPGTEIKGKTSLYTSKNGHMFSFLIGQDSLALRLPDVQRERFMARYDSELVTRHGHVMKEYVLVPAELLLKTDELAPYFAASLAYVSSLKPKPTTKRKRKEG